MRLKYDEMANALYIYLQDGVKPVGGEEVDPGTLVDLDEEGRVIGIEILNPGRVWPLDEIVDRYEIDLDDVLALRSLAPFNKRFPFGVKNTAKLAVARFN